MRGGRSHGSALPVAFSRGGGEGEAVMSPTERRALIVVVVVTLLSYVGYEWFAVARASAERRAREAMNQPVCPQCGPGEHVEPICYGLPNFQAGGSLPRGVPGGCMVTSESPAWCCARC